VIFSDLMDANSLFLTANADTIYYVAAMDLSSGPIVIEQPPKGVGTINDMWFSWIIDIGFPGPARGEGGKYLIVPPGYEGPLPDSGFFVAHPEPATSYDVELAGQLAAIGIVKGQPFATDARMKNILTDAANVGAAAGRVLNWRYATQITKKGMFKPNPPTGARTLDSRTAFYYG
jgi:hypothetical protein